MHHTLFLTATQIQTRYGVSVAEVERAWLQRQLRGFQQRGTFVARPVDVETWLASR